MDNDPIPQFTATKSSLDPSNLNETIEGIDKNDFHSNADYVYEDMYSFATEFVENPTDGSQTNNEENSDSEYELIRPRLGQQSSYIDMQAGRISMMLSSSPEPPVPAPRRNLAAGARTTDEHRRGVNASIRRTASVGTGGPINNVNTRKLKTGCSVNDIVSKENSAVPLGHVDELVSEEEWGDLYGWLDDRQYQHIYDVLIVKPELRCASQLSDETDCSAMDLVQQRNTRWTQVNRVIDSGIVGNLNRQEVDFIEAKFEILTSEASYLKSLNFLKTHFIDNELFKTDAILSRQDHTALFSGIKPVRKCSTAFLFDLEKCWKEGIYLHGIFDVVYQHAKYHFKVYATYCAQIKEIQEKLTTLCENKKFAEALSTLESSELCQNLTLDSFLALPMIRITKLPLPIEQALNALTGNRQSYGPLEYQTERDNCLLALDFVRLVADHCNRNQLTRDRMMKMFEINRKLIFPDNIEKVPLISPHRWFVACVDVKRLSWSESTTKSIMKHVKKSSVSLTLFLLNDMLIFTKKKISKSGTVFLVKTYGSVANLSAFTTTQEESKRGFTFVLILKENHEKKWVEMVLSCGSNTERDFWVDKLQNKSSSIYADTRLDKTMACVYPFRANDPGHLFLREGDQVTVTRILDNGWYEGVRMRGGKSGVFPPSRVVQRSPRR